MNAPVNIEQQFAAAMTEHGLVPPEIVADGRIHRFAGPNEKRGKHSGWYVMHVDGVPTGTFGDWRTGLKENWCARAVGSMPPLSGRRISNALRRVKPPLTPSGQNWPNLRASIASSCWVKPARCSKVIHTSRQRRSRLLGQSSWARRC